MKESEKIILDNVEDELTIVQLDDLDKANAKKVIDKLKIIDLVLKKHREQYDNTTLVKMTNYLTPVQIRYLDDFAEKQGLISQGKKRASGSRSAALRYILDQIRLKSN
jgi:hypothetical protein